MNAPAEARDRRDHWPEGGVGEAVLTALAEAGSRPRNSGAGRHGDAALRKAGRAG